MELVKRTTTILLCLLLIPITAIVTASVKQRFADGPNRVFSGGPLRSGELHRGSEPDWSFVENVSTIELQLLEPPQSRRIWTAELHGKATWIQRSGDSGSVGRFKPNATAEQYSESMANVTNVSWYESSLVKY